MGPPALALLAGTGAALACELPVYEYALREWRAEPYRVYYVHDGPEAPRDQPVNNCLDRASTGPDSHANLTLTRVSAEAARRKAVGTEARAVWARHETRPRPFHVVVAPDGRELWAGRLDQAGAGALVDSPARQRLAEQLGAGKHAVLLVLLGRTEAANAALRKAVQAALARAGDQQRDVAVMEVAYGDQQEVWLRRQLVPSPERGQSLPVVFAVFGRGHVIGPSRGAADQQATPTGLLSFVHGACSCSVREEGGVHDLLINCDWEGRLPERPEYVEAPSPYAPAASGTLPTDSPRRARTSSALSRTVALRIGIGLCVVMMLAEVALLVHLYRRRRRAQEQ